MKKSISILAVLMGVLLAATVAFAECQHGKTCPMGGKECSMKQGCDKSGEQYQCPVAGKFMKKAAFFLDNSTEIGLSDDQVGKIKVLKDDVQKIYVRQGADMQVFMIDLQAKMSEPKVDVDGINKMIDSSAAAMTQGTKSVVEKYAQLKAVLSDEQMNKAKAVWKKNEK
jgi:hypothetical protein